MTAPSQLARTLFSVQDVKNLLEFAGMRPALDIFQMDPGLSYGLGEFGRIIDLMESYGFSRDFSFPHGGHLINLHIACGMNLGGCEAYPNVFQPFGGYSLECKIERWLRDSLGPAGFGLEAKPELKPLSRNWAVERKDNVMKIAVVGCGAMGSIYAALLADAGNDVLVVDAWAEHVDASIPWLRVEGASGDRTVRLRAFTDIPRDRSNW